jgi:lysozyme
MRHITQQGLDLIKHFEGFSPTVYKCPAGLSTIGYGHLIRKWESFTLITEAEAEDLLRQDVQVTERAVLRLINVPLTDGQFDALVSFTFNLGSGSLQNSTLRRVVNRNDHCEVPTQLKRWVWSGGKKLKGLQLRRSAESSLYELT